jgi:histone H4
LQEKAKFEIHAELLSLKEKILGLKAPKLKEQVQALKTLVLLSDAREKKFKPESMGKDGPKRDRKVFGRFRQVLRDNIQGITKPAIRRLARRGGVKRISGDIYEETRSVLKVFLENVIRDVLIYIEHGCRRTITATDVVYALKRHGHTLYGFGA